MPLLYESVYRVCIYVYKIKERMKKIKVYIYCCFVAITLLTSSICLCVKGVYQFAAADLLLLAFLALNFVKLKTAITKKSIHDAFFLHGAYIALTIFSMLGSIGYLFYYNYTACGVMVIELAVLLLLAYYEQINLHSKNNL